MPGVKSVISKASTALADHLVEHGDEIYFGELILEVHSFVWICPVHLIETFLKLLFIFWSSLVVYILCHIVTSYWSVELLVYINCRVWINSYLHDTNLQSKEWRQQKFGQFSGFKYSKVFFDVSTLLWTEKLQTHTAARNLTNAIPVYRELRSPMILCLCTHISLHAVGRHGTLGSRGLMKYVVSFHCINS